MTVVAIAVDSPTECYHGRSLNDACVHCAMSVGSDKRIVTTTQGNVTNTRLTDSTDGHTESLYSTLLFDPHPERVDGRGRNRPSKAARNIFKPWQRRPR